ncbi:unnamed protein product [Urochloa humidicola]
MSVALLHCFSLIDEMFLILWSTSVVEEDRSSSCWLWFCEEQRREKTVLEGGVTVGDWRALRGINPQ